MDHAKLVMACRFGWAAGPDLSHTAATSQAAPLLQSSSMASSNGFYVKRFQPCRGRLYHQLTCSHRVRTDLVEDCGSNCLDPLNNASGLPFYCHECLEQHATNIWNEREAQHNSAYLPLDQMTKEQYEQWYDERRRLELQYLQDRKAYELELRAKTRPSNICSTLEASKDDIDFAAELDSLSLAVIPSNESMASQPQHRTNRLNLPTDVSEQLHWGLNALSLERGSCGLEYSKKQTTDRKQSMRPP
jgi:hypothetical protein